jgi:C-terminal processing protease CtpA/Prc
VQQTVENVNPNSNLYSELGVAPSASADEIKKAYEQKKTELAASTSPEAGKELARAEYVKDTLTNPTTKERYDTTKSETTIFTRALGSTLYLQISRMSPTTVQDVTAALDAASSTPLSSLIIDLRGNIGGALDQGPSLIGMFLGVNQYVFDLYHQNDFQVIRSPIAKLPELQKYKEIAVLTDNLTQSTAEVMTAAVKRFHLATVVGTNTRGWGTVEGQYPLTTKIDANTTYGLLLVYALTLRDDNQPIDGVGVDPDININDKNWKTQLPKYFRSASLISAVEQTVTQQPQQ